LLKQEKKRKKYDKLLWAKKASESSDETLTLPDLEKQKKLLIKKTFRLDEQIKYAVLMQENQWKPKNIEIKLYLPEVHYFGNEELLFHAWINLINNAIKFTPENGKIFIFHSCTANELTITIRDTGIGIEKNIIDHIFNKKLQEDKNSSAEDESELVRVKGIINLCSGKMSVKSIPDKGSTFIVTLERSK
jgi:signal transduction histidine kinase